MKDDKANNFVGINLQNQLASKSLCSITAAADAGLVFQSKNLFHYQSSKLIGVAHAPL